MTAMRETQQEKVLWKPICVCSFKKGDLVLVSETSRGPIPNGCLRKDEKTSWARVVRREEHTESPGFLFDFRVESLDKKVEWMSTLQGSLELVKGEPQEVST